MFFKNKKDIEIEVLQNIISYYSKSSSRHLEILREHVEDIEKLKKENEKLKKEIERLRRDYNYLTFMTVNRKQGPFGTEKSVDSITELLDDSEKQIKKEKL